MANSEQTRIREHGTHVTNTANFPDSGIARIDALRQIMSEKQYAKIDGVMVDLFTASAIIGIYDKLNEANQSKYRNLIVSRMADIAFKIMSK